MDRFASSRARTSRPKTDKAATVRGEFMHDLTAPLFALMNTRHALGWYAQQAILREQRRFKVGRIPAPSETEQKQPFTKDLFYFRLRDTNVPLPLGWMLSAAAARTMQDQLRLEDDGDVHNGEAMDEVL